MEDGGSGGRIRRPIFIRAERGGQSQYRRQDVPQATASWKDVIVFCLAAGVVSVVGCLLVIWQAHGFKQ